MGQVPMEGPFKQQSISTFSRSVHGAASFVFQKMLLMVELRFRDAGNGMMLLLFQEMPLAL